MLDLLYAVGGLVQYYNLLRDGQSGDTPLRSRLLSLLPPLLTQSITRTGPFIIFENVRLITPYFEIDQQELLNGDCLPRYDC